MIHERGTWRKRTSRRKRKEGKTESIITRKANTKTTERERERKKKKDT